MAELKHNGQVLNGFPVVVMKLNDYATLPVLGSVHPKDIEAMTIGYQFRFVSSRRDGLKIVAEVVEFGDAIASQWGGSILGCPKQWVNRYAVIFQPA